jgi:dTDP-4-amino-4,6-dideoxygalactose transaminase
MLVTNNAKWATRAKYLTTQAKDDPIEYVHHTIGYNYRLTNIQAAVGCAQMEQLDTYVEAKRQIAVRYQEALSGLPGLRLPEAADWAFSTFWMYTVLVDEAVAGVDSRQLLNHLRGAAHSDPSALATPAPLTGAGCDRLAALSQLRSTFSEGIKSAMFRGVVGGAANIVTEAILRGRGAKRVSG